MTMPMTINIINPLNSLQLDSLTTIISVTLSNIINPDTLKLLTIADSWWSGHPPEDSLDAYYDAQADTIKWIGTIGTYKHEGVSGRNYDWHYTNATSNLTKAGVFDYSSYLTDNSLDTANFVLFATGINDIKFATDVSVITATTTAFSSLKGMIDSIKAINSSTYFGITQCPVSALQDAWGDDYGAVQDWFQYEKNRFYFNTRLKDSVNSDYFGSNVYLVPIVGLDRVNNYPVTATALNARNTTTYNRQTDSLHPANGTGFAQVADNLFAFLKTVWGRAITYGPEKLTNGNFSAWTDDDPDGWSVVNEFGSDPEISEVGTAENHGGSGTGSCNIYTSGASVILRQSVTVSTETTFLLTFDVLVESDPGIKVNYPIAGVPTYVNYTGVGSKSVQFTTSATFNLDIARNGNCDVTIDNVSIKEVY